MPFHAGKNARFGVKPFLIVKHKGRTAFAARPGEISKYLFPLDNFPFWMYPYIIYYKIYATSSAAVSLSPPGLIVHGYYMRISGA